MIPAAERRPRTAGAGGRIRAFDGLRGIAVLVMIQTHSLVLLRPGLRAGPFWNRLQWVDYSSSTRARWPGEDASLASAVTRGTSRTSASAT